MIQEDEAGDFVMSVCDPFVNINRDPESPDFERSEDREIQVAFESHSTVHLLASTSGLPQTNPPLDARIENNTLIFTTRNGVTDTFRLRAVRE